MPTACANCAASLPDDAVYCPGCGCSVHTADRAKGRVGVFPETIAGALAYFLLPAVAFLFIEPYKENRFVRFHSFQSLAVCLATVIVGALVRLAAFVLSFIPFLGNLFIVLVVMLVTLAWFMLWLVLVVKALQGERFKLPLVGAYAERQITLV
jgi:uncharacterized membrane protein